jgi:hypothetical protein
MGCLLSPYSLYQDPTTADYYEITSINYATGNFTLGNFIMAGNAKDNLGNLCITFSNGLPYGYKGSGCPNLQPIP